METFAYLHLALAYEDSTDAEVIPVSDYLKIWAGINRQKRPCQVSIHLLSLFAALAMLSIATQTLAALQLGDKARDVYTLQDRLYRLRFFKTRPTGYFGEITRQAVRRFQSENELPPTGIADAETQAAISSKLSQVRAQRANRNSDVRKVLGELRRGAQGDAVRNLQTRLQDLGYYSGPIDGQFGSETEEAVKRFQRSRGIVANGIFGPQTRGALIGTRSRRASQQPRSNNSQLKYLVAVPDSGDATLNQVRRYVPNAGRKSSGLGRYIDAGRFSNRSNAESLAEKLRSHGLDARVVFQ